MDRIVRAVTQACKLSMSRRCDFALINLKPKLLPVPDSYTSSKRVSNVATLLVFYTLAMFENSIATHGSEKDRDVK
jgi:hypothetical protein